MKNVDQVIINMARGANVYTIARQKIALSLLQKKHIKTEKLNNFLAKRLFKVDSARWKLLSLNNKDWGVIDKLRSNKSTTLNNNYLSLLTSYIISNKEAVNTLYEASKKISSHLLLDDGAAITQIISELPILEQKSLFVYRINSAQNSTSSETLLRLFNQGDHSTWIKKRFIYPLVYFFTNNPNDTYLDTFLSYVINGDLQTPSERAVIRLLLRDEIAYSDPIAFKAYVALLCHPFDACEMLINHIENLYTNQYDIDAETLSSLQEISAVIQSPRLEYLHRLISKQPYDFCSQPSLESLRRYISLPEREMQIIRDVLSHVPIRYKAEAGLSRPIEALIEFRLNKYPTEMNYDYTTANITKWQFLDAFRLVRSLMFSLYLLPRREKCFELREALRLIDMSGGITPFAVSGPSVLDLIQNHRIKLGETVSTAEFEDIVGYALDVEQARETRLWMKLAHWDLRQARRSLRLKEWFDGVRSLIPVAPSYLSGIDWAWVDASIKKLRLRPFVGNPSAIYTLLLGQIEDQDRDSIILRTAIEPLAVDKTILQFVDVLIEHYDSQATAFVRYFLTVQNILMLQLAPNETAALTGRIRALEKCVRRFGFNRILDETHFIKESKTLTAALMLSNISGGQFEVAWRIFKVDASDRNLAMYEVYKTVNKTIHGLTILGSSKVSSPNRFRNGKVVEYTFENYLWPLANVVLGVIETFIEHPSFGIEVLLSSRFRHDTMRKEYENAIDTIKQSYFAGIAADDIRETVEGVEENIFNSIEVWMSEHLQTQRPSKSKALFDFAPTQDELSSLVNEVSGLQHYDAVIDHICEWLQKRLEDQAQNARSIFANELPIILRNVIQSARSGLEDVGPHRAAEILRVLAALETAVIRVTDELIPWFSSEAKHREERMTLTDVKAAVEGLFESQLQSGTLRIAFDEKNGSEKFVDDEKIRLSFDLLSEIFRNTIKHSYAEKTRLRITFYESQEFSGWRLSSTCGVADPCQWTVAGERYTSVTDAIFREGNSGLPKIAALSATLIGKSTIIHAIRKRGSFHLYVPLRER